MMMEYVQTVFQKYFDFSGRARRSEYWYFALFTFIVGLILGVVDDLFGLTYGINDEQGALGTLFSLLTFFPSIAVGARRLHDTGRSGWWQLIMFTIIGIPVLIYWLAVEGDPHSNEYGTDPKNPAGDDDIISHLVD